MVRTGAVGTVSASLHCQSRAHAAGGDVRARRRSISQRLLIALWRGDMCQRVSIPCAPPLDGVRIKGRSFSLFICAPYFAARCKRRMGVSGGGVSHSAMTVGMQPLRRISSIHHKISSVRLVSMKVIRPGSRNFMMPWAFKF